MGATLGLIGKLETGGTLRQTSASANSRGTQPACFAALHGTCFWLFQTDTLAPMSAAQKIRDAVARVAALRLEAASSPGLLAATTTIKRFQARRFAGTYADLFDTKEYAGAARFFLDELYSDKDYSLRDAQFARIAGALQTFFPSAVVATAVSLAELHALTEEFDHQMAIAWRRESEGTHADDVTRYVLAWKSVGHAEDRHRQLDIVLAVGRELDRLTRTPGLRLMLRMMRRPAASSGLGSLQNFLEAGFDTFANMSGNGARALEFLNLIKTRESHWFDHLFGPDAISCEKQLRACLSNSL